MEYITQAFENNTGVVEYIPQLLHYSITCPSKNWLTSYIILLELSYYFVIENLLVSLFLIGMLNTITLFN